MGSIRKQGLKELLGTIPELLWTWVEETDSQLRAQGASEALIDEWRAGAKAERDGWLNIDDLEELEG